MEYKELYDVFDRIGDRVIIICVVKKNKSNFRFDHFKIRSASAQGGSATLAHAHPGKNEPFWFLFYIYLFVNKKPKFDPVFVFCHFCIHPLQNAMKEKKIRKETSDGNFFFFSLEWLNLSVSGLFPLKNVLRCFDLVTAAVRGVICQWRTLLFPYPGRTR